MKYINTNKLNDTQYEFLSNLVIDLAIVDKAGVETEFEVGQLKEDEDGVIYAPTAVHEFVDVSPMHGMGAQFEQFESTAFGTTAEFVHHLSSSACFFS